MRSGKRQDLSPSSLGVTLHRLFSGGAYPYGEIEPFTHPRFGKPKSLLAHRPDLPAWLDGILAKAFAVKPQERYADSIELAFELENGLAKGGQTKHRKQSLYDRNPLLFWKIMSMGWFLAFLFSLMWHALSQPR